MSRKKNRDAPLNNIEEEFLKDMAAEDKSGLSPDDSVSDDVIDEIPGGDLEYGGVPFVNHDEAQDGFYQDDQEGVDDREPWPTEYHTWDYSSNSKKKGNKSLLVVCIILAVLAGLVYLATQFIVKEKQEDPAAPPSVTQDTPEDVTTLPAEVPENVPDETPEDGSTVWEGGDEYPGNTEDQRPLPNRTETYTSQPSQVADGQQYATLYCPSTGVDASVFYGSVAVGMVGQDTATYPIGWATSHIFIANGVSGVKDMTAGTRFAVETSYGKYLYQVNSVTDGFVDYNTGEIVDSEGNILTSINNSGDVLYIVTGHQEVDGTQYRTVIKASLIL